MGGSYTRTDRQTPEWYHKRPFFQFYYGTLKAIPQYFDYAITLGRKAKREAKSGEEGRTQMVRDMDHPVEGARGDGRAMTERDLAV